MDFVQDAEYLRAKLLNGSFGAVSLLFEATIAGDKDRFIDIVESHSGVLEDVSLISSETPLHIASGLGHYAVVKEIVLRKPGYAREINQDGYSPLHLASAMGHKLIVKELLYISKDLCFLKDKYGRTALHCATMMGKLDVVKELLDSCPRSMMEVTARRETALHIAVMYNQAKAVQLLVEWILQTNNVEVIINMKDRGGNTILHLATSRKQLQTINILLADNPTISAAVEVNATNAGGFTALDIFDVLPQNEADMEIIKVLQRAGSLRARHITKPIIHNNDHEFLFDCKSKLYKPSQNPTEFNQTIREPPKNGNHVMLLTTTMMATIIYCAALCPPGSILKAFSEYQLNQGGNLQLQNQILNSTGLFIFSYTGFFTSIAMIIYIRHDFSSKPWVMISVFLLVGSYFCLIMAVSPNRVLNLLFLASITVLLAVARVFFVLNSLGLEYFQCRRKSYIGI